MNRPRPEKLLASRRAALYRAFRRALTRCLLRRIDWDSLGGTAEADDAIAKLAKVGAAAADSISGPKQ